MTATAVHAASEPAVAAPHHRPPEYAAAEAQAEEVAEAVVTGRLVPRGAFGAPTGAPPRGGPPDDGSLSGGSPLEPGLRAHMQDRLGHDFGRVRVHRGADAAAAVRSRSAHAFAFGEDVLLGADVPAPATRAGRRVIAHELTHVVQQRSAAVTPGVAPPHNYLPLALGVAFGVVGAVLGGALGFVAGGPLGAFVGAAIGGAALGGGMALAVGVSGGVAA